MPSYQSARQVSLWSLTWSQIICLIFLRLPRIVPRLLLRYTTSTSPPFPQVIHLPSREPGRTIYCWLFLPPRDSIPVDGRTPLHIDFHGGGFVTGQLAEQAPFCSLISRRLGAVVLTVDYRLGPLSKYPAAIHDAEDVARACIDEQWEGYAALRLAVDGSLAAGGRTPLDLDATRLSLSGFSSGGNLALNLLVSPPNWPSPVSETRHPYDIPDLLFYPSLDLRMLISERPLPLGMKRSSGLLRWLGSVMGDAYLERWQSGEIRASPGLAGLGSGPMRRASAEHLVNVITEGSGQGRDDDVEAGQASANSFPHTSQNMLHPLSHSLLVLPSQDSLAHQSSIWLQALDAAGRLTTSGDSSTLGVTPLHVSGAPHGWTQFPDFSLSSEQRRQKYDVLEQSIVFVERVWRQRSASS